MITSSGEKKMDVLVIGAMKAATSTVCAYLEDHPEAYMVPGRDPNYFSYDDNFAKGEGWYTEFLDPAMEEKIYGEGSNHYAARDMYPETATRIAAYNPNIKIIYIVRDPIDRIVSAWIQNRVDEGDNVPPTLDRAVREMPDAYVGQSLYWHNIQPYLERFGENQIFVGFMEDLKFEPDAFFARLCDFLDISYLSEAKRGHLNKSSSKRVPNQAYTTVGRLPLAGAVKAILPQRMKTLAKDMLFSQSASERPDFSPEVRREVVEQIAPDSEAFLAHFGAPKKGWSIS